MEKKLKNCVNLKGHHTASSGAAAVTAAFQSVPLCTNSYVVPPQITSIPPGVLLTPSQITNSKDTTGLSQQQHKYNSSHYQSTKQCTSTNHKANYYTNTTAVPQSTMLQKNCNSSSNNNNNNNTQPLMNTKAAACIVSPIEQLAAIHAKATSNRNKNEEAIYDLRTRIPEIENIFDIHSRIGNGTFSTVLLGTLKKERDIADNQKRKFAIKHHIPTSHPDRIMKELQCMAKIGGTDNVVGINCCIRYNESVAFIMPYLAHDRFHDFYSKMEVAEVQYYLKNLLIALRHVHRFNVIHRDVKPSNFLYNRRKRQFLLVDFGLAQQAPTSHTSLATSTNSLGEKLLTNSPLPVPGVGEGKRLRDQDDNIAVNKSIDGAVAVTGAGEIISGTAKRLRCTGPQQQQQQNDQQQPLLTGPTTRASAAANTGTLSNTPFKMPLKQINELPNTPPIASKGGTPAANGDNNNINTNIRKSGQGVVGIAVAANTMSSRLQQKLRVQGGGTESVNSSARTSSAGIGKNTPTISQTNAANNNSTNASDAKYNTNRNLSSTNSPKCFCYGNHQVCNICLVKKEIHASRAGTPGYRPPEVLLKYPDQTTAVDVWAAGVIFLSVLSSVYPFFKAPNDFVALAEMITIFGDKTIRKTAFILDRLVTLSQKTKPLDLRKLCVRFRNRTKFSSPELLKKYQRPDGTCEVCKNCDQFFFNCLCMESNFATESLDADDVFPPSAYDLLYRLLEVNPHKRITADEALSHPFFQECYNNNNKNNHTTTTSNTTSYTPVTKSEPAAVHQHSNKNNPAICLAAAKVDPSNKTRD